MRRTTRWPAIMAAAAILLVPALAFAGGHGEFEKYEQQGWLWMFLGSFGAGFLTSLTPCVYPMIPITLGIFGARGKDVSRGRALMLATAYVVGMGLTYAALGVTFALLGGSAGALLAKPYVVLPIVGLFMAMAASLFGAFDLNLPASWQAKLNQVGGKGFGGAFAMGLVGGFIAAPCTGPFLAGLLAFVTKTNSVVGGGSLLFVYALGMGVLFWVLAAAAMSLPKSGRWMEWVKSGGGLLLLIGAIYFTRPLLPWMRTFAPPDTWFLWASLGVLVFGLGLGAIHLSFHGTWSQRIRKGLGIALTLAGVFGAWTWKLTPKQHLPWLHDPTGAYAIARAEHKGVMVDFTASWCPPCQELELTFGDDEVYDAILDTFVPLQFDVSDNSDEDSARRKMYRAETNPTVAFVATTHERQPSAAAEVGHVIRLIEPDAMLDVIYDGRKSLATMTDPAPAAMPWLREDEGGAFAYARARGKGVLLVVTAKTCATCGQVLGDLEHPGMWPAIAKSFVPLQLDATDQAVAQRLRARFQVDAVPATLFITADGSVIDRVPANATPQQLAQLVGTAAGKLHAR